MNRLLFCGLWISIFLVGCQLFESEGALEGGVFIADETGESTTLESVSIRVFREAEIRAALKAKQAQVQSELAELRNQVTQGANADKQSEKLFAEVLRKETEASKKGQKAEEALRLQKEFVRSTGGRELGAEEAAKWKDRLNQYSAQWRQLVAEKNELAISAAKLREEATVLAARSAQAKASKTNWPNRIAGIYFEGLPESSLATRTDGEGKFSLKIPRRGRFALAAHGERRIGELKEDYYWLVWITLEGKGRKVVILGNDNRLDVKGSESVVQLATP